MIKITETKKGAHPAKSRALIVHLNQAHTREARTMPDTQEGGRTVTTTPTRGSEPMPNNTPENDPPRKSKAASKKELTTATLARRHLHAVEAAKTYTTLPTLADVVYMAREFITCTIPHSDPGPVLSWSRKNGDFTLGIVAGVDIDTGKSYGIPYGIIPRLLLVWMVTEIIRTKSRRLELGNTLGDFLAKLGLDPSRGGKRSDARRVREQMERLFRASIHFLAALKGEGRSGKAWKDGMQIAPEGVLWWHDKDPAQGALWGSYVIVSQDFFDAVMKSPNPLDIRVLQHVKDSSMGIDLYTILNREAFRAMKDDKPRFLAWEWLHEQTGNECERLDNFRRNALVQVEALLAVHSGLIVKQQRACKGRKSGLVISNLSRPSIPPDLAREPIQRDPNRVPPLLELVHQPAPPPPPPEKHLKPATVARFRGMYPRLDPYACKADFDAWAQGLPPEKKPRHYDAAFKGFAERWVVGKLIVSNP